MFPVRSCPGCKAGIVMAVSADTGRLVYVNPVPQPDGVLRLRVERDTDGSLLLPRAFPAGATIDLLDVDDDGVRYMPHHQTCTDPMARRRRAMSGG